MGVSTIAFLVLEARSSGPVTCRTARPGIYARADHPGAAWNPLADRETLDQDLRRAFSAHCALGSHSRRALSPGLSEATIKRDLSRGASPSFDLMRSARASA